MSASFVFSLRPDRCMLVDLPTGPDNLRTPFRLLECDVTGGDQSQISDEDSAVSNSLIIVDDVQSWFPAW